MELPRQLGSIGRSVIILAGVVILLAGLKLGAPIVGPFLLVVFFAILCRPVYVWLGMRMSKGLALLVLVLILVGVVLVLAAVVGISAAQLYANLDKYRALLTERFAGLEDWLTQAGLVSSSGDADTIEASAVLSLVVSFVGAISSYMFSFLYLLIAVLFLVSEGPMLAARFCDWLGAEHPLVPRMYVFNHGVVHYFGMRATLNAFTGLGVAIALALLGIDFAALWGVLLFFMSFVPYIGIFIASVPPVILAFAEYGIGRALLVIVGITVVNLTLENVVMPRWVGRGFKMPAFVVYISFFWWNWLLGPAGALMGTMLTLTVAMLLDSFPTTRGLSRMLAEPQQDQAAAAAPADSSGDVVAQPRGAGLIKR